MSRTKIALYSKLLVVAFASMTLAQPFNANVGFDGGDSSGFSGNAFFESTGGNPGGNAHFLVESFGAEIRTGQVSGPTNEAFLGDYSNNSLVTIGVDVQVDSIQFGNSQVPRNLGFVFIDRDIQGPSGPSGLWFGLGEISSLATPDWTRFELTIDDFSATGLPPGWIGFGDEDPDTFEPILPDGATFASVLSGVDEFRVSTFEPGFFFGFTNFDVRLDNLNVSVVAIPEPGLMPLILAMGLIGLRRRARA